MTEGWNPPGHQDRGERRAEDCDRFAHLQAIGDQPRQHQGGEVRRPEVSIHLRRVGRCVMKRLGEHQRPEALDREIQRQVRGYPDDEQPDLEMTEQAPEGVASAGRKFGGGGQASLGGERLDFSLHNLHAQFRAQIAQPQHNRDVHREREESHYPDLRLPGVINRQRLSRYVVGEEVGADRTDRQQSECQRPAKPRRHIAHQRRSGAGREPGHDSHQCAQNHERDDARD